MRNYYVHVKGRDKGLIVLYALSTCLWCNKFKKLLLELGVDHYYTDVDTLAGEEKEQARGEVLRWKKRAVYPCLVINDERCIPVYDEELIRKTFT